MPHISETLSDQIKLSWALALKTIRKLSHQVNTCQFCGHVCICSHAPA